MACKTAGSKILRQANLLRIFCFGNRLYGRIGDFIMTASLIKRFMLFLIAICLPCRCLLAADNDVVFGSDPPDAVKGHIFVRAVVESGYETDVTVELYPYWDEGIPHRYELSEGNEFGVSDDIQVGEYDYVSYVQDEETYTSHVPHLVTVSEGEDAYFIVVVGSRDFVREYEWLSDYTKDGQRISGVITSKEAEELYAYDVSQQWGDTTGSITTDETGPGEDPSYASTQAPEGQPEHITPEEEKTDEKAEERHIPAAMLAISLFVVGVGMLLYIKRKRD